MSTAAAVEARIRTIDVTETEIVATLVDGRRVSVPLAWSWRLAGATHPQRQHYEIIGDGTGIHWPDIDEHIGIAGMLHGTPAVPHNAPSGSDTSKC